MGGIDLGVVKKQASLFLRKKIKAARLLLTDVTNAQLLAEEVTNSDPWGPETRKMAAISQAAFEVDDYWRIMDVLNKRLSAVDKKRRRESFKTLVLLEYLLTHGPKSVATEFQNKKDFILQLANFRCVDDKGIDWGQNLQRKVERIVELLNDKKLLQEERDHCRKVSRQIRLGSFSSSTSLFVSHGSVSSISSVATGSFNYALDAMEENERVSFETKNGTTITSHKNSADVRAVTSKCLSSPGCHTHTSFPDEYFVDEQILDTCTSSSDMKSSLGTKNCNVLYNSCHEQRSSNTNSMASWGNLRNDIQKQSKCNEGRQRNGNTCNIIPLEKSDSFCEWDPQTEAKPLLNSSRGESYNNPRDEAVYSEEIHPLYDIDKGLSTECLVLNKTKRVVNKTKRVFVDISDFHNYGSLITKRCTKFKVE